MGEGLARGLDVRSRAARWLAAERFQDWDLSIAIAGEVHSAVEALWHGVDPSHPLLGGMGPNHSDVASMVLLPELLYRHAFGHPLLTVPPEWTAAPGSVPILDEGDGWSESSETWVPMPAEEPGPPVSGALLSLARRLPGPVKGMLKGVRAAAADWRSPG